MTTEELYYINSVSRRIDVIEGMIENPGRLRIVKNIDRNRYFEVEGYFLINEDVSNRIGKILENAQEEIQSILKQELEKLKSEFTKIVVQTPKKSDNETN